MCDMPPDAVRDDGGTRVRLRVTSLDLGTAAGESGPMAVVGTDAGLRRRCPRRHPFRWALGRLCPFLTFVSFRLFPLSGFDVGTDSFTDAVRLILEVLNTQDRVRLRRRQHPLQPLAEGVKPLPLRRFEALRSKLSARHDPRAHDEDASLRIKRLFAVVLLDTLFQVAQPRIEASCERLRVGNPVLNVGKQTLAPGQDQCGESHDRNEQDGPNQPGTRWTVATVSPIVTIASVSSSSFTMWILLPTATDNADECCYILPPTRRQSGKPQFIGGARIG